MLAYELSRFMDSFGSLGHLGQCRLALLLCIGILFNVAERVLGVQILHGHVPAAVAHLQPIRRLSATTNLDLAIGLPLRNKEGLSELLEQIYTPSSPHYRHYLTPEQFTERFGPTEQDYQALIDFVKTNGLIVTGTHPNRVLLDVRGSVANLEKVLHVKMRVYQHPTEARTFYAPDIEPSLDLAIPVLSISGLNNYNVPHPKRLIRRPSTRMPNATPNTGSGPSGAYMGYDFRDAYVPGVTLTGAGQVVGLVEFDGYYSSDITAYENQTGLPGVPLANVLLDGFKGTPTTGANSGNTEVALDIEMAISMAPGLSKVIVYEAGPNGIANDILSRMVSDNQAKQISCSWAFGVAGPDPTADQLFQEMAAQGQSFFDASGDSDAFVGSTAGEFPSDDPYITQVGGTTLTTTGPGGSYVSETVWNWGFVRHSGYVGSSGGISTIYSIPSWQQGISTSANQGSATMRNIPDVAMVGDNVSIIANNGQQATYGGTSLAAPLWAGFTALVNQDALANGQPVVGFVNPSLYVVGKGADYLSDFHDITTGNNEWPSSPTQFSAVAGYDLCTGWGTPTGGNLIDALAGVTNPPPTGALQVSISPAAAVNAGAQWQVDGGAWQNSGAMVAGLALGGHTVHFNAIAGWTSPADQNVTIDSGTTTMTVGTYTVTDTTPPALVVVSPTDYQIFTNASVNVAGTASDASGIESVTVNGIGASLVGTNWSQTVNLSLGTNSIMVIATDNSPNLNAVTQMVHAVYSTVLITSNPTVTNALLQVGDVVAVVAGETNAFTVNAVDSEVGTLSYQWLFGDGTSNDWSSSSTTLHAYPTNCGPYLASVAVSDGQTTMTSNLNVAVACQLAITRLRMRLDFAKPNADRVRLRGILDLGTNYDVTAKLVTLDVGGAQMGFILNAKGRSANPLGTCRLVYHKRTQLWTLHARLKKGSWQTAWAAFGLTKAHVREPGIQVTLPVIVVIDNEAFADERTMTYTATLNKYGWAK